MASTQPPAQLLAYYQAAAAKSGVPVGLLIAQGRQESGFQTDVVSPAGAVGVAQLMPGTAAGLGVNPRDPQASIMAQAQLMASYLKQFSGSVADALAAYNAGPGAVQQYGGVPPYSETQTYVTKILAEYKAGDTGAAAGGDNADGGVDLAFNPLDPLGIGGRTLDAVKGAVSDALDAAFSAVMNALEPVVLKLVLLLGGVTLVVAGMWRAVSASRGALDDALDPGGV
jgi:soluble lytic murein transglycosylase-like protein